VVGANSTVIVQVPPLGAIDAQVLAVTLYGGVAAGATVSVIETGLGLVRVTSRETPPAPANIWPKLRDFGCVFRDGAKPLPVSLTCC